MKMRRQKKWRLFSKRIFDDLKNHGEFFVVKFIWAYIEKCVTIMYRRRRGVEFRPDILNFTPRRILECIRCYFST